MSGKRRQPPCILICLPLEGQAFVARTATDDEWPRLIDWIFTRPRWVEYVTAAYGLERPIEDDDGADDEDEDDELIEATMAWRSYSNWPQLRPDDLVIVAADWVREHGADVDQGSLVWDEEALPFDPDAGPADVNFRPRPEWPPSLRELEERE